MKLSKKAVLATAGLGVVAAAVFGVAVPAFAAQYYGETDCSGTRAAAVNVNSGGGSGVWYHLDYSGPVAFTFGSGSLQKYSPYQSAKWDVGATVWHSKPYGTCA